MKFLFGKCVLLATMLAAGGCAPKEYAVEENGAFDPIEPINRGVYGFNKKIDFFFLRPAAKVYDTYAPERGKNALSNVFSNLGEGKNIANHILQKNGDNAVRSVARLVFNSTVGVGGLFDVADKMGIEEQKTDFGATLRSYSRVWNGRSPAYIVLPLLGPSSPPDAIGIVGDGASSPITYVESNAVKFTAAGVLAVKKRAELLDSEGLIESSLDEYTFVRDFREELRQKESADDDLWGNPENIWNK